MINLLLISMNLTISRIAIVRYVWSGPSKLGVPTLGFNPHRDSPIVSAETWYVDSSLNLKEVYTAQEHWTLHLPIWHRLDCQISFLTKPPYISAYVSSSAHGRISLLSSPPSSKFTLDLWQLQATIKVKQTMFCKIIII